MIKQTGSDWIVRFRFCVMLLCVIGDAPFAFHFSLFIIHFSLFCMRIRLHVNFECCDACLICACHVCMFDACQICGCPVACQDVCPRYLLRGCDLEWRNLPLLERGAFSKPLSARNRTLGEFRSLRRATRGAASGLRKPLKRLERNFNPLRTGYVCGGAVVRSVTHAGRNPLGAVTFEKPRIAACTANAG